MNFLSRAWRRLFGGNGDATPEPEPTPERLPPEEAGRALRQMILTTSPSAHGAKPTPEFPHVVAVLIDWPIEEVTATVFAASSGDASLYTTGTFGIIGGGAHAPVREAAIQLARQAQAFYDRATPCTEYPYPAADKVRFYFVCFDGVRAIGARNAELEHEDHPLYAIWMLGQDVITQLRLTM